MEKRMNERDRRDYLELKEKKFQDKRIISLIKEDIDCGLTDVQIDDYTTRDLDFSQMQMVSKMYREGIPAFAVAVLGGTYVDAERMKVCLELYKNGVELDEIKKGLQGCKTARDMRLAFASVFEKVQNALAVDPEKASQELKKEDTLYAYVEELMTEIRTVVDKVNYQDDKYASLSKKLDELAAAKKDEVVTGNLTKRNKELEASIADYEKQIEELSAELSGKQDEIAKGLQLVSKLRKEIEDGKEERAKMQNEIDRLSKEKKAAASQVHDKSVALDDKATVKDDKVIAHDVKNAADSETANKKETGSAQPVAQSHTVPVMPIMTESGIPVYYTMTIMQDAKVIQREDIDYMNRKPSVFGSIMSHFASKRKSHRTLMELVISKDLSPEQVNEIKVGLEKGLDEEQLELIINKNLSAERIRSIVGFAVLQNSLSVKKEEV